MKPGSLIERINGVRFNWLVNTPPFTEVPENMPVVLQEWKFAEKWNAASFYLAIEGYHEFKQPNGSITYIWYDYRGFRELQPPMDLSFIEEIQISQPLQIQLT